MSGGYCSYCCAQTAWETDTNTGATYCTQCYMQPKVEHTTPQCVNCGSRAGYYEDNRRGARYCNYCRQMMTQPVNGVDDASGHRMPHDPRYENDPLEGLHCPYCARGDAIYNTTEGGGYPQTMCRRCRRPVPNASADARQDIRAQVNPNLFRVYDEFDPANMRQRFENVQPPSSTVPPHLGQTPSMPSIPAVPQKPSAPSFTSVCSNCHTGAYLVQNPSTGILQCTRCGQWVARGKPTMARPSPQPPVAPTSTMSHMPTAGSRIRQSDVCPKCGVRGVVMGGHGYMHCPQCRRPLANMSLKQTPSLQNIQSLFEPGSPEKMPQPNRIGSRDDDVFRF